MPIRVCRRGKAISARHFFFFFFLCLFRLALNPTVHRRWLGRSRSAGCNACRRDRVGRDCCRGTEMKAEAIGSTPMQIFCRSMIVFAACDCSSRGGATAVLPMIEGERHATGSASSTRRTEPSMPQSWDYLLGILRECSHSKRHSHRLSGTLAEAREP